MNEILERWKALQDVEQEHDLFDAYVKARQRYLDAIKAATSNSPPPLSELDKLYREERDAFDTYTEHRLRVKN
ncbi:hypothetical protein [uncultured Herbaspirillum sp.]|uniref:hypothetical protein n=1 Tax=uncultured Herbaspirillum sp. TaxID=160236 RepID=UPI0026050D9B|nr:hypothetical protein [uncultured Herbaspirillum sp.]